MNKCFITKLPSSVDNDNLPVLGQLRINWLKQSDLTDNNTRAVTLGTTDSITVKVSGAHFTDSTLTNNLGDTKTITNGDGLVTLYVSNDTDAVLTIDNKYSLSTLDFNNAKSVYFDIEDIKYCTNLITLYLSGTSVTGDISALSKLTALTSFNLAHNNNISGDISAISKLTALTYFYLDNTHVSGDISAISKLTDLYNFALDNTNISGEIDSLANLTKLSNIGIVGLSLTGDMSKIPAQIKFISCENRKITTNFTWTANGRKNATLLAMVGSVPFDTTSMDNMFIDQATCTFKADSSRPWLNAISVSGSRTSASDSAVATLQNMGVTITGVTKQA